MTKNYVLSDLCHAIERLVVILRLDENCQWTKKFERDLLYCQKLLGKAQSKEELNALSQSIVYVFQGMGSFNDYTPATYNSSTGRYERIIGTEDFDSVTEKIFNLAIKLRSGATI